MITHLVSFIPHPLHQVWSSFRFFAYHKNGSTGAVFPQAIQQAVSRSGPGAIVKGQGDIRFLSCDFHLSAGWQNYFTGCPKYR